MSNLDVFLKIGINSSIELKIVPGKYGVEVNYVGLLRNKRQYFEEVRSPAVRKVDSLAGCEQETTDYYCQQGSFHQIDILFIRPA